MKVLIHNDTLPPQGSLVLEAGYGVGAQTKIMAAANPLSQFVYVDLSKESVNRTKISIDSLKLLDVESSQVDIQNI